MLAISRLANRASSGLRTQQQRVRPWSESRDEFHGLLRKLLREASYLPDAPARSYFHARIIAGFRAYQPPQGSSQPHTQPVKRSWKATSLLRRLEKLERLRIQANQTLHLLARANAGDHKAVDQMLGLAYGRTGPLREQLLEPQLLPDEPQDDSALRASIINREFREDGSNMRPTPVTPDTHLGLPAALIALRGEQAQHRGQLHKANFIRDIAKPIPKTNMWGRAMPLRRVHNLKRKMYLELRQRLLPPLSTDQWERLKRLASGEQPWEGRSRQLPASPRIEVGHSRTKGFWKSFPRELQRKIDQRFMQHRYRTLFEQTPCITRHSEDGKWKAVFGTTSSPRIPFATLGTLELFGIDTSSQDHHARKSAHKTVKQHLTAV